MTAAHCHMEDKEADTWASLCHDFLASWFVEIQQSMPFFCQNDSLDALLEKINK